MPRPFNPLGRIQQAYRAQRHAAMARGIAWEFDFESWLRIWNESGRLAQRGRGAGRYCMARHGDAGPYSPWNVSIKLSTANCSESFESRPYLDRKGRIGGPTGIGGGKGVYDRGPRRHRRYQSTFRGKYLGSFVTSCEARIAYEEAAAAYLESVGRAGVEKELR